VVSLDPRQQSSGDFTDTNEDRERDFPASADLALSIAISGSSGPIGRATAPIHLGGSIEHWPFYGESLESSETAEPIAIESIEGGTLAELRFMTLSAETPTVDGCANWVTVTCTNLCGGGFCCTSPGSMLPSCSSICTPPECR